MLNVVTQSSSSDLLDSIIEVDSPSNRANKSQDSSIEYLSLHLHNNNKKHESIINCNVSSGNGLVYPFDDIRAIPR